MYFRSMKSMEMYFTVVYIDTRGTGKSDRAKELTLEDGYSTGLDSDALRPVCDREQIGRGVFERPAIRDELLDCRASWFDTAWA